MSEEATLVHVMSWHVLLRTATHLVSKSSRDEDPSSIESSFARAMLQSKGRLANVSIGSNPGTESSIPI
jgi:hypothetical protein